jgi:hypothetical protein
MPRMPAQPPAFPEEDRDPAERTIQTIETPAILDANLWGSRSAVPLEIAPGEEGK